MLLMYRSKDKGDKGKMRSIGEYSDRNASSAASGNTCCYIHNSVYHNPTSLLLLSFQLFLWWPAGRHPSVNLDIYVVKLLMLACIDAGQTSTVLACLHSIIEPHNLFLSWAEFPLLLGVVFWAVYRVHFGLI